MNLNDLRRLLADGVPAGHGEEDGVRRQWWAALATLQDDLLPEAWNAAEPDGRRGLWLAAPLPALYEPALLTDLQGWVWAPEAIERLRPGGSPLLPVQRSPAASGPAAAFHRLPLREEDGTDPLLVLITPRLQVALALDGPAEGRRLVVRFDADVLSGALDLLDRRLQQDAPQQALRLRRQLQALGPLHNDASQALRFWPLLAERLAAMAPSVTLQTMAPPARPGPHPGDGGEDAAARRELALLEALTHEVRTPLATIRTLIRSLLRRRDLTPLVRQRLEQIDGECSEQIDRFGLIFLAAEQQRQRGDEREPATGELARTDLSALLLQLQALWERQLARRDLSLELAIAPELPPVLSDPARLETMLGGLIDRFGRSLPAGSRVRLSLRPAGSRLKLQLSSDDPGAEPDNGRPERGPGGRRVGPVLSWNPGTGSLQLSRQATRELFHRLGGRLTERGGSSLTVFFPLAERHC